MFPAAYRRARHLTDSRIGSIWLGHFLAVTQAVLFVLLVAVGGLLLSLAERAGVARLSARQVEAIQQTKTPKWVFDRLPAYSEGDIALPNTGLYPLVEAGRTSGNIVQRYAANQLDQLLRRSPILRDNVGALKVLLALGLALLLGASYAGFWRRSLAADVAGAAASALRHQIHRQTYRLGQSALPSEGSGPAVDLFTREANDVRDGLIAELDHATRAPVLAIGLLLLGLFTSWQVTIFLVALAGLALLVDRPLTRGIREEAEAAARDSAVRLLLLQEDLSMLRTVRVYGMEEVDRHRFEDHLKRFQADEARRIRADARTGPALMLVNGIAAALAIGLLVYLVLIGRLSPASAAVLAVVAASLSRPILQWLEFRGILRQADRSAEAIFRFLERKPELQQNVGAQFLAPVKERIVFENVSLDGPTGRALLSGVSIEIPAKTRTAVLSLDEASKYAVACLIPRLIDPKQGRVRMDGLDLRDVTLESLRAQVGLVLQADLVFNDTVFANIGLGDPSYALPKIIEAAKVAHAHHLIQDLPHGYDTPIGSLGHYLRPDEQYRIALARAFLHDPSLVVIEEPTTALDDDTKSLIDDTIDRLALNRTVIFLPHRLSTIRKCDRVLVLQNGKLDAFGPPRDVHIQSKLYRHIQYVEFNQFATGEIEAGQMGG
ncbi:MAG: ABC-type multidrug transport system, ATPase and permease component [Planctomycetota bacterium]|nr:ABC-type multidrug transport system, ATPase and permease component [Planctomycetota bacterium]